MHIDQSAGVICCKRNHMMDLRFGCHVVRLEFKKWNKKKLEQIGRCNWRGKKIGKIKENQRKSISHDSHTCGNCRHFSKIILP